MPPLAGLYQLQGDESRPGLVGPRRGHVSRVRAGGACNSLHVGWCRHRTSQVPPDLPPAAGAVCIYSQRVKNCNYFDFE